MNTTAGSAAQIVLTQIVPPQPAGRGPREERAGPSTAEVTGPGAAGALIKLLARRSRCSRMRLLLLISASILRGVAVKETPSASNAPFGRPCARG